MMRWLHFRILGLPRSGGTTAYASVRAFIISEFDENVHHGFRMRIDPSADIRYLISDFSCSPTFELSLEGEQLRHLLYFEGDSGLFILR